MLRRYCPNSEVWRGPSRKSAELALRISPPLFEFSMYDWAHRQTWALGNSNWNVQSRASLGTLRQSPAWVMNTGISRSGEFTEVRPNTPNADDPLITQDAV